ncbi:MAG TPA: ArdC-like ssDNA-binding domain-containing protein [Nitrosospira sp.]|nr:ArdC-like ssDNA-binding domain-containing protein [Nitrosospira sp.]
MKQEYAEQVSAKIIEQLQQGAAPWQRPWAPGEFRLPFNPTSGKEYRGINTLWLQAQGYSDPRWLTSSQAKTADVEIKPGEKGTEITYWKFHEDRKVRDKNGQVTTQRVELDRPRMFSAVVFNAEQTIGLPPLEAERSIPEFEGANAISDQTYTSIRIENGHANPYGSMAHAKEELRGDIASLMIAGRIQTAHESKHHIAYRESWIKALKEDPREIFRAAADAEKIVAHVLNNEQKLEQKPVTIDHTPPEKPMPERTYLAVPFNDKDEAKKAGAKWDKQAKSWYAPEGIDQSPLSRWIPSNVNVVKPLARTPEESFANALRDAGLVIDGRPIMDGNIHRVSVEGDKGGKTSGAYAGHMKGRIPGGYIENFKTAERINWKYEGKIGTLTPQERTKLEDEAKARLEERKAAEAYKHGHAAEAALTLWGAAKRAAPENAYCKAKGITYTATLRVVPDAIPANEYGIKIAANAKEAAAMRAENPDSKVFIAGDLLVPGYDEKGKLCTLQTINEKFKGFMKGSRKHGVSTIAGIDGPASWTIESPPIVITEGYATGDTVARLLGHPVYVAFDSGNLSAVASHLRDLYPDRPMLIAADNDHAAEKNVGAQKAQEAAQKYGAGVMLPPFAQGEKGSDWDDYARIHGDEAAKKKLEQQMVRAKIEAVFSKEKQNAIESPKLSKNISRRRESAEQDMGI